MATIVKRQRAFLGRSKPGANPASWRPVKIHRAAARRWCTAIDLQFQVSTGKSGLNMFLWDDSSPVWQSASWAKWPYMVIATDMGSDALCGYMAMERLFGLNVDISPDVAHGLHCDVKLSLLQCQLYGLWFTIVR